MGLQGNHQKETAEKDRRVLWLGVDGGGTNTRAALVDAEGVVRGEGRAEAANFHRVGLSTAVANIVQAVDEACAEAGIGRAEIVGACCGLAGVGNAKHRRQMHDALGEALGIGDLKVETDARVALAGATDLGPGVVIIAGTGSIAYGVNERGEFARAGGWGPAMGDEGSGYYIGRRALEAVVSAWDHRSPATSMTEPVCRHFGVGSPPELPAAIYEAPQRVMREIAQLAKIVVREARSGDEAARAILTDAGIELARAVIAVVERLKMQAETFRIAYVGGVFEAGELIIKPMREAIGLVASHAFVAPPLLPPVLGAAQLARVGHSRQAQLVG
jgi:N-acetylglucosamine kinase-like BadF-type ATPase